MIKTLKILLVSAFVLAAAPAFAGQASKPLPLRSVHDAALQDKLNGIIQHLGLEGAVRDHKLAVALVDVSNLEQPEAAQVNGDEMLYAASLPKIGILLAAFVEIQNGNLKLDDNLRQTLTRMIRFSSNADATRVLNLVGKRRVNEILQSAPYRLYDPRYNGGLWVGKEYGRNPAFERDPLHHISHGATAMQVARFYYLLETGQLVNPRLTAEMKEILSKPGIHHKFVAALDGRDVSIFRKSGTWRNYHADSALVEGKKTRYILVGLVQDAAGGAWLTRLASAVDKQMLADSRGPLPAVLVSSAAP
jgi:beta-lactamase class A